MYVQAVDTSGLFWEVAVPQYHVKCKVFHTDALAMASVLGNHLGNQMAFGMLCVVVVCFHLTLCRFLKCRFTSTKFFACFCEKNLVGVKRHFKIRQKVYLALHIF